MDTVSVRQMFKALLKNDQAVAIVVSIVLINCSIYITSNLVIYFFKYDFGGTDWFGSYTLFNIFGGAMQILSMILFSGLCCPVYLLIQKELSALHFRSASPEKS